jgi:hypothetical protein
MSRLDDYRSALLAAFPEVADAELGDALEQGGSQFVSFIIDHGLGPLWHACTEREDFRESRLSAEALYLAQQHALEEIDAVLEGAGIEYAVIKGAASRQLLYDNPALRACHDLDLLVRPEDRVRAATALIDAGFSANPDTRSISRELVLSRGLVDVDLHWGLLREGRLRSDPTDDMIGRRRREKGIWMLNADDALFVLLVHPAFAKHLAGWDMGLHRVVDIVDWLNTQSFNREAVRAQLATNGVRAAAWATLHWVNLLTCRSGASPRFLVTLDTMISDLRPGRLRRAWLDRWLRNDLSARTADAHLARLLGFSLFLHDTLGDSVRALAGRRRAHRRSNTDMASFGKLFD